MKQSLYIFTACFFFLATALQAQITLDLGPDQTLTCITTSIQINPTVSGATNPSYEWIGPGGFNSTTLNITVNSAGMYTLTVTDLANGNTASDQINILQDVVIPIIDIIVPAVPNCDPFGGVLQVANPQGNTQYNWSTGQLGPIANNLAPGTYCVTATDNNNGCTATDCEAVLFSTQITLTGTVQDINCFGLTTGSITITATGGLPPYVYLWSNNETGQTISNLTAGQYSVTVTDAAGCTQEQNFIINQPPQFIISTGGSCNNTLTLLAVGGIPPYAYSWTGPNGFTSFFQNPVVPGPGAYSVTVIDANGCSSQATYVITPSDEPCTKIYGRVVVDTDQDCVAGAQEMAWANLFLRAEGPNGTFYGQTDSSGNYNIYVTPGAYTVTALPNDPTALVCPINPSVNLNAVGDSTQQDFAISGINPDCPLLSVDLSTAILRRCFNNNYYYVSYCNLRPFPATEAYIELTLDPFLTFIGSALAHTNLGNNVYRFDLGTVDANECGNFWVQVEVSCAAVLGQTHCSEAHIYPDTLCNPANPLWTGAEVKMRSECTGDSLRFIIKNTGNAQMSNDLEYIVIEDGLMNRAGTAAPLAVGDSMIVSVPANGATWRVEADQEPFLPTLSVPVLSIEGCTNSGFFSTGFVEQFPSNDYDAWLDIECRANQGSYDPNDKQGFPVGYGADHYIKPETEIEYLIRFQNTGTDTAFNIYILDTLSSWLDPLTIQPGASSHDYRFELRGEGTLLFDFKNIMLPDSNVNEPASNGFVKFRIRPRSDVPLETDIFNSAAIYFDFNEPIITNTTQHRIGENFITVAIWDPWSPQYELLVAPNPAYDRASIRLNGSPEPGNYQLSLMDLSGRPMQHLQGDYPVFEFQRGDLPAGMYFFRISKDGALLGSGKLMLR